METNDENLSQLEKEHHELQFDSFSSRTALTIGLALIEKAEKEGKHITIDIQRNGHQLFHFAFDETSPDNDEWIKRKSNMVNRFGKSSYYITKILEQIGQTLQEKYLIDPADCGPAGGSFPIIIKDTGPIGTITVSGLTMREDHEMVVQAIRNYLAGS